MKRTIVILLLMATSLGLTAAAGPAAAGTDGGGRSVFARGAGERALALGGAYVAVADDAGGLVWNPAGLARNERKSFYASHTNLIGLGFSEQFGAVTLPSWRTGNFGLGLRRFGVDGIEGRDERGAVFADDLSDSETELLLGYGRTLGDFWHVGLVFKYQQQNLAGYSDGAPGLDLGVIVRPLQAAGGRSGLAEALTVGLAVRNIVEPTLKLDEDGVPDPTGLRFGLALAGRLGDGLRVLAVSDVEKTRRMDARLHAGLEVQLLDILALRVGSNADQMTAGAGIDYRNLSVNYTFEDNPLESVHRFGLGIAFGPTTAESRQASLDARAAELESQLATAFRQENASRVQQLLAEAATALRDGDPDGALRLVETVRVLEPTHPELASLEAGGHFAQGWALELDNDLAGAAIAYQRCLGVAPDHADATARLQGVSARSNRLAARSEAIRSRFDAALEAYARGELLAARNGLQEVLQLSPDDQEAAALLRNTRQTLDLRTRSLLEQSRAALTDPPRARALLAEARALNPEHPGLAAAAAAIAAHERELAAASLAARRAQEQEDGPAAGESAPVPVQPSYAALSARDKREVADLYGKGITALEAGRNADAVRYWELVWNRAPDYQQVAENLRREYLALGMESFAAGRLEESISTWEKAESVVPDDPQTRGYLARAYEHRERIRQIKDGR